MAARQTQPITHPSQGEVPAPLEPSRRLSDDARRHPWWVACFGILSLLLGGIAIGAAVTATLATALLFGALLLLGGLIQVVDALASRGRETTWRITSGVIYALIGGLLLYDPVEGAIGLTFLLALFFVFAGIYRIAVASQFAATAGSRGWMFFSGLLSLLLGLLIWLQWPGSGVWVIGLFIGIELILSGVSLLLLAATRGRTLPA